MGKPALGRGLGDLMNGQPVAGNPPVRTGQREKLGRGLETLVGADTAAASEMPSAQARPALLPTWFFFAADLLLLAFTVAIVFDASAPMEYGEWLFCVVATSLGCLFGIAGVLAGAHRAE